MPTIVKLLHNAPGYATASGSMRVLETIPPKPPAPRSIYNVLSYFGRRTYRANKNINLADAANRNTKP
jgi:hypothetical protein